MSLGAATGEYYNTTIDGAYFTNTTYAYYSMLNGDGYVTAFDQGDYQIMTITGITETGYTSSTVDFYLADYTSANSDDWYIVDEWTWVDLSDLGSIIGFQISFTGTQSDGVPALCGPGCCACSCRGVAARQRADRVDWNSQKRVKPKRKGHAIT